MGIFADLFVDMMATTVTVELILTRDYQGKATYGTSKNYVARVNNVARNVIGPDGQMVVASGIAWLDTVDPFSVNDRVSFADGTQPILLRVDQVSDETGPAYTSFSFQ